MQPNENQAIDQDNLEVIKGTFTPEEALEVIDHLIKKKINFHQHRNFSSEIRFGHQDTDSLDRIQALREIRRSVERIVTDAKNEGKQLKVNANINIELV